MYKTILLDPPWNEVGGGKIRRGADRHYGLLKTPDIIRVVSQHFKPDRAGCHVWLWVTDNHLRDGLLLFDSLGVRYVRTFVWVKAKFDQNEKVKMRDGDPVLHMGLGQYGRGAHEMMLFGVIGRCRPLVRNQRSAFLAPVGPHSVKPEASYRLIEAVSPPPRLELFARRARSGWSAWGNELCPERDDERPGKLPSNDAGKDKTYPSQNPP